MNLGHFLRCLCKRDFIACDFKKTFGITIIEFTGNDKGLEKTIRNIITAPFFIDEVAEMALALSPELKNKVNLERLRKLNQQHCGDNYK